MVAEDAAAGLASPLTNQALRNQARDILQGAEYQAYMADKPKPGDDWLSKWLDQIGQWLHDLFRDHPPEVGDTGGKALEQFIHIGFFAVLVFVALVLLLALLWWGYTLVRAWLAARRRDNRLMAQGWRVLRFGWEDLVQRPAEVVELIRRALDGRS